MPSNGFAHCSRGVVRASSNTFCACCALVFQIFFPLTIQRFPSRTAVVRIRDVSVPASSSVTPKLTCSSPVAVGGR